MYELLEHKILFKVLFLNYYIYFNNVPPLFAFYYIYFTHLPKFWLNSE